MKRDDYEHQAAVLDREIGMSGNDRHGVILQNGADVKPVPIQWLWHFWIALGKLMILAGAPGAGKTTIVLALAATLSRGGKWPDGSRCEPGNVLIWSGEDDMADTLVPRLLAMGADMSKVYFITGARVDGETVPFDPARDMVTLNAKAKEIGDVKLLMVDPVASAVAGDSHKNGEVRRALQPLVDLGFAARGCCDRHHASLQGHHRARSDRTGYRQHRLRRCRTHRAARGQGEGRRRQG